MTAYLAARLNARPASTGSRIRAATSRLAHVVRGRRKTFGCAIRARQPSGPRRKSVVVPAALLDHLVGEVIEWGVVYVCQGRHKADLPRRLLFVRFLAKATSLSDGLAVGIMSTRPSTALRGRSFSIAAAASRPIT